MDTSRLDRKDLFHKLSKLPKSDRRAIEKKLSRLERNFVRGELRKLKRASRSSSIEASSSVEVLSPQMEKLISSIVGPQAAGVVKPSVVEAASQFLELAKAQPIQNSDNGDPHNQLSGRRP
ncbi:MAG: hypothetical protein AAGA08_16740 [Pseudomonadota bacterium]